MLHVGEVWVRAAGAARNVVLVVALHIRGDAYMYDVFVLDSHHDPRLVGLTLSWPESIFHEEKFSSADLMTQLL